MVKIELIESSNRRIKDTFGPGLVAVFVGATNGIGETTVKQFAQHAEKPRAYLIGRSQEAGDRIVAECKASNNDGEFWFIKGDTSLMRNVDTICKEITAKEKTINLLFLTVGTLQTSLKTEEGMNFPTALTVHGRHRFISNFLPQIKAAEGLRRVVSVFSGTFEGRVDKSNFQAWDQGRVANQGHLASITTLDLESFHKEAPEVSFIHNFPGAVESGIDRGQIGWLMRTLKTIYFYLGSWVHIPLVEAGERHLYLGTSARFPASAKDTAAGVLLEDGVPVARGTNGEVGSGVYSIDVHAESASPKVETFLAKYRDEGMVEWIRQTIDSDIDAALASK